MCLSHSLVGPSPHYVHWVFLFLLCWVLLNCHDGFIPCRRFVEGENDGEVSEPSAERLLVSVGDVVVPLMRVDVRRENDSLRDEVGVGAFFLDIERIAV